MLFISSQINSQQLGAEVLRDTVNHPDVDSTAPETRAGRGGAGRAAEGRGGDDWSIGDAHNEGHQFTDWHDGYGIN